MIQSMTGFGSKELEIRPYGRVSVELKSTNHKFLETVLHLPDGFLSFEDDVKSIIETRIKRGRVLCMVNLSGSRAADVFVNKPLLKNYLGVLKAAQKQFAIEGKLQIDTLVNLPGVLALEEKGIPKEKTRVVLKAAVRKALEELVKTRQKEGRALSLYLKNNAQALKTELAAVEARFDKAVKEKTRAMASDEERSAFLNEVDIGEEVQRLKFHARNFTHKLIKREAVGKELDFIAQEMQREANTLAAKSFDPLVSARVVKIKSRIEKIREQAQNVE